MTSGQRCQKASAARSPFDFALIKIIRGRDDILPSATKDDWEATETGLIRVRLAAIQNFHN
jgi:hypothetical protein